MNEPLSQAYIDKNNNLTARQLVLASHRLAMVIQLIYGNKMVDERGEQAEVEEE